ncbi:Interferon-induced, double-stranded RNA-activated protein kinase [Folsomia candida]|uniref:Interferon-induced, double-stranded RNA-activated protein kinase n=1 Tax=Folsomia candida TaxID=158441 RepID=A0A226F4J3_FOLCA|nr:Interferon-induced, double-stranded RNA-activated protein kinase [Folsomia candida]
MQVISRPPEVQLLLPPPHPITPLTPPWKSNPSLICLSYLGEEFFGKVYQVEDQAAIAPPTGYAIKCIDMKKTLRSCSSPCTDHTSSPSDESITLKNSMNLLLNEMQIMDELSSDHVVRYYGCWAEAEDCSQLVLTKYRLKKYIHELIKDSNNSATSTQNSPLSHIFIRMELCHSTLKHYLQAYPEQGGDEISIVQQVATGLLYVHSKGYIHRDIKPGNIFFKVESSSGKLTWKIGDFGLAVMSRDEGNVGAAGTYLYQSPEMRERLRYTDKTDLYSLGLVWVEILHRERRNSDRSAVFGNLRGYSGIERRKYMNNCCMGKFKKVVKIVDQLLIADPGSRICSDKLCTLLKCLKENEDKSDTIPGTNCSSNETYCETDGKCILISNVSNCVEADVKNNGWNPGDPGVLTFVVIGIAVFTLIGICIAVFVKKKKKKSKRSRSDIPLPPIHQELQLLLPSPHPVFPLTPPWKSNPSLICLSLLGEGFFGKVYQVEDQAAIISPTCYAIKCIDMKKTLRNCSGTSTTSSTTSAQSTGSVNLNNYMTTLVNEMQIMDQLSSDQVVRYYGCWAEAEDCSQLVLTKSRLEEYIHELIANSNNSVTSTQNSPLSHIFIKMELCHTTLKNYLQAYPEQVGDEISIVQQVATGLLYVHSKGYIHRDIKPGNIFCKVEESSGKLTWKIGDFGLAVMSTEGGNVGVAGTYRYQSPEMRKHSRYTLKTDLYSLGLVWVEILYRNSDKSAVFEKVRGFNGIERRKYLNTCCLGKFKNVVKIVDLLLISEPDSRICSGKLCNLLKSFNANEVSIII